MKLRIAFLLMQMTVAFIFMIRMLMPMGERFMSMGMFVLLSPSHRGEQNEGDDGQFQRTEKIPESTGEALCVG